MATTANGIDYEELAGSPKVSAGADGSKAHRMFKVAWTDYDSFMLELAGLTVAVGGQVASTGPLPFPPSTHLYNPRLMVSAVACEPFMGENDAPNATLTTLTASANAYAYAKVEVDYTEKWESTPGQQTNQPPTIPDATFLTYEGEGGAQYHTIPGRVWKWSSDGVELKDNESPGKLETLITHVLTWHRVVRPPWTAISACCGCVNQSGFLGKAAGLLLFGKPSWGIEFSFRNTAPLWSLTYRFSERRNSWNQFLRRKPNDSVGYEAVETFDGTADPYEIGDFDSLFSYEP